MIDSDFEVEAIVNHACRTCTKIDESRC